MLSKRRRLPTLAAVSCAALIAATLAVVTASPAGATDVANEAELRAAFADPTETLISLTSDISLTSCTDTGTDADFGDLDRVSGAALDIEGGGFTVAQTCTGERVIEVSGNNVIRLLDLTVTGGNDAPGLGGGILFQNGVLELQRSAVLDNNAIGSGGGINADFATITLTDSTIAGNSAANTGGVHTNGAMNVYNSTITDNSSFNNNGGIYATSSLTLVYATVVDNTGPGGANLFVDGGDLTTNSSIIARPLGGGTNCDLTGVTSSGGYNYSDDQSCSLSGTGDVENGGDPQLGALGDNGGPTPTMLPAQGSPVIDMVLECNVELTEDQRGVSRPIGPACDAGAVEAPLPGAPDPDADPDADPGSPGGAAAQAGAAAARPVSATPAFTG